MPDKKIIAVLGATGSQGGGLVRAIAADPEGGFTARALTRDPDSDKARQLADLGAEVVAADVDDPASLEKAFAGAHGAYCVTFFWNHMSPEREFTEAGHMARAAKAAGVRHVVWSTLEDTRLRVPLDDDRMPTLHGKYKVPHFDAKGEADALFREAGVPTTYFAASYYWDNLIHFGMGPKRAEDGKLDLALPLGEAKLAGIASEDIGGCAYGVFQAGERLVGESIGVAGGHLTGPEMAAALGRALGEEVRFKDIPFDVYRSFDFPGADDLGNMFQFYHDFEAEVNGLRDVGRSRELNPQLKSFDDWLAINAERMPIG